MTSENSIVFDENELIAFIFSASFFDLAYAGTTISDNTQLSLSDKPSVCAKNMSILEKFKSIRSFFSNDDTQSGFEKFN